MEMMNVITAMVMEFFLQSAIAGNLIQQDLLLSGL